MTRKRLDMSVWRDEVYESDFRIGLKVEQTIFEDHSPFQRVTIVQTAALGRALLLDDVWMTAEGDEKPYHEMLTHPALTTAGSIGRVLVIGGGDGGTVREVLRYPDVERVDLVEVDALVIEACKTHLPTIGTAWHDPRMHVHVGDGVAWVRDAEPGTYDVILVDGSDPVGPAIELFGASFYDNCRRSLRDGGVLAAQAGSPTMQRDIHFDAIERLGRAFDRVHPYYTSVVIYPGGAWGFAYASNGTSAADPAVVDQARATLIEAQTEIYNRDIHGAAFALPNYVRRALGR